MSIAPWHDPSVWCSREQETRLRRNRIGDCLDDITGRNGASLMSDRADEERREASHESPQCEEVVRL